MTTKQRRTAITPTRAENYPLWYQAVIKEADLAENAVVRGCMVIKPWGYALWEAIQKELDAKIKATGHENFYFPMFLPLSFMEREAQHVEGFAKECAVVTHHRLAANAEGKLIPEGKLEEPLIIRPTSEVIIGEAYSRWIQSYRDLPIMGNQWANVVRWEMRPRIFLRTSEFLWQEGHTAHATAQEAIEETEKMLEVYQQLAEDFLAMPVIIGAKTPSERFPGAEITYCLEAMMQDGRALQAGTSHFLGQNFAKAFSIDFLAASGEKEYVWTTSWGVSTRLIGGLIMTHSDDDGLVLPPAVAPLQVVIIPVLHDAQHESAVMSYCHELASHLQACSWREQAVRVQVDKRDRRSVDKVWEWVKKGVPIRIEIGPKEVREQSVYWARRDEETGKKTTESREVFSEALTRRLEEIQKALFARADAFQKERTHTAHTAQEFESFFHRTKPAPLTSDSDEESDNDASGSKAQGFVKAFWACDEATEQRLRTDYKVVARCIPLESIRKGERGTCIFTGAPDAPLVVFGRAY